MAARAAWFDVCWPFRGEGRWDATGPGHIVDRRLAAADPPLNRATGGNRGTIAHASDFRRHLEGVVGSTLLHALGIEIRELSPTRVVATMPVDERTRQPFGLLHGGASVALAETVASLGGGLNTNFPAAVVVGIEINANHLRAKQAGIVTAIGTPIHLGRTTQVWQIVITDELEQLVCVSRCTLAVLAADGTARLRAGSG